MNFQKLDPSKSTSKPESLPEVVVDTERAVREATVEARSMAAAEAAMAPRKDTKPGVAQLACMPARSSSHPRCTLCLFIYLFAFLFITLITT